MPSPSAVSTHCARPTGAARTSAPSSPWTARVRQTAVLSSRSWTAQASGSSSSYPSGSNAMMAGPAIIAFEPEGYDELDPDDEPVRLQLLSTAVWRTRAVQQLHDADVLAAPVGGAQWVLTADGLGTVVGARTVRGRG